MPKFSTASFQNELDPSFPCFQEKNGKSGILEIGYFLVQQKKLKHKQLMLLYSLNFPKTPRRSYLRVKIEQEAFDQNSKSARSVMNEQFAERAETLEFRVGSIRF